MKFNSTIKTILVALTVTIGLSACSKKFESQPINLSGLNIIQASPTTEKLDVYVENTKGTPANFSFGNKTDYLNAYSGTRRFSVTMQGETTALKSETFTLEPQAGYSLFVIDKLETIGFLYLKDDLTKPQADKAKVRFVNLSPDGGSFDLLIAGKTESLASNKGFRAYSDFIAIDAADKVTFNVKNSLTGNVDASVVDFKVEAGQIYTIWVKGLKTNTDETKLGVEIYTHK